MTGIPEPRPGDSAGIIVFRERAGVLEVLLIEMRRGCSYPKGHLLPGETAQEAARREVWEESGITAEILPGPVWAVPSARSDEHRNIYFFPGRYVSGIATPQPEEVSSAFWCPVDEAAERIAFPEDRALLVPAADAYRAASLSGRKNSPPAP